MTEENILLTIQEVMTWSLGKVANGEQIKSHVCGIHWIISVGDTLWCLHKFKALDPVFVVTCSWAHNMARHLLEYDL